ncbi:NAD(P)/FAD-dependent oxidoreductase [Shewanella putrefaciens]|uniref:Amine oxidase n=3 Tax=Shewanella putrefaciens TaxID=24 RepID=E6XHN2_SHEP2|nr:FAD-dependent oxidoreductase [Shewanella putrefaciens]AVV85850.1 amine oxidase [Shewanella putrefaciens]MCT8944782.1 FAD-dependent oxidoreductase [Shewanella putrefaciens]QGS49183.1 NAD(P)-binding protein [Shewanella putrefaciens]QSE48389.1 FAD-dependent oxidoreductase [Shewanella putrefaciens]QYX71794.1 FAD-dependent oxidoreductase [Shewanella putrefaciens]
MKNIAIVGTGISGLTCGHLLSESHKVTVFEANDYIGGHTATVDIHHQGQNYAIDTGFIVFNDRTYPRFERLLARLKVKILPTEMSFSVHNTLTGLEYNGHHFSSLFAQKRNIFNPRFWTFLREILRFNKSCKAIYQQDKYPEGNLGDFLEREHFSPFFAEHYILPMGAAIWSSSIEDMRAFSLRFFIRFFEHHGLLNVSDRPQWYVLEGGSRSYIPDLIAPFKESIHLNSPVSAIERQHDGVRLLVKGEWLEFDEVILACHSDQALRMLMDPTSTEKAVLGDLQYQDNDVVLHTDTRILPQRKAAWASWNYRLDGDLKRPASVTYNMNILQQLPANAPTFCITLNQSELIDEAKVLRRFTYAHPVFNEASLKAQARREEISGHNHTHFAGAYWHNGFHEDGVRSALDVCAHFGVEL